MDISYYLLERKGGKNSARICRNHHGRRGNEETLRMFVGYFPQKSPVNSSFFAEKDLQLKEMIRGGKRYAEMIRGVATVWVRLFD